MRKIFTMTTASLEDPEVFAAGYASVSRARQEKIDRIPSEQEKRLSLAAALLIGRGLESCGHKESEVRILTGKRGKPYFPDYPDIHFSVSHSGRMAMASFSDTETGCDIQQIREPKKEIAGRFFCPEETAWIHAAGSAIERKIRFYRLWTLKESYLKLTGEGMHLPMDSFCFAMEPVARLRPQEGEIPCICEEYAFGGYRAAVIYQDKS